MDRAYSIRAIHVCDSARNFHNTVVGARTEIEFRHRHLE
jgi:hypothetical protein